MAADAANLDPALAEFATTLTQDNTPAKLRCINCHNIAVNAWRIPCCAMDSCDSCKNDFPDECPSCLHSPVPKEDFKPNKKLRNTIKAFLKSKVTEQANKKKKAEAAAAKAAEATPIVPSIETSLAPESVTPTAIPEQQNEPVPASQETAQELHATATHDDAAPEDNAVENGHVPGNDSDQAARNAEGTPAPTQTREPAQEPSGQINDVELSKDGQGAMNMPNGHMPFAGMNGFPMDPSQMMNMGVMGMPGMDPMAMMQQMTQMQTQMFGGYNGGMNMNGGYNQFGGYNGQQNGWSGQENYQSNYGGYNQGNYNQMNQQYDRNGFQYGFRGRGRGRGRGFYGRGGYQQNYRGNANGYGYNAPYQQNYDQGQGQYTGQDGERPTSKWGGSEGTEAQTNGDIQMTDENKPEGHENEDHAEQTGGQPDGVTSAQNGDEQNHADVTSHAEKEHQSADSTAEAVPADDGQPMAIQTFMSDDPRGRYGHKMIVNPTPPVPSEPRGVPGAPTGPRALREGLPNTGASGRGFAIAGRASNRPDSEAAPEQDTTSRHDDEMQTEESKVQTPADERSRNTSRTRSRSPQRSSRYKNRRDRSRSPEAHEYDDEKRERREEKRHRRHKYEDEYVEDENAHKSSHRSHRSHRHRDRSRDKDKDRKEKDRDRDHDRRHHKEEERSDESGSRKRRHRDRDDDDYDRHERKKSRRDRSASYNDDKDRRSSRKHRDSKPTTPITPTAPANPLSDSMSRRASLHAIAARQLANRPVSSSGPPAGAPLGPSSKSIPTGPRGHREGNRRERRHRKDSMRESARFDEDASAEASKPAASEAKDPHTLEREARNQERLMKEMQRRANAGEMGGGNRSSKKSRRVSYKYEDEDPEERRREIEREREDARWG